MARMAPSWISTSNTLPVESKPRKCPASRIWPVEDTGRNSVRPSSRPSSSASISVSNWQSHLLAWQALLVMARERSYRKLDPCRSPIVAAMVYRYGRRFARAFRSGIMLTLFHHPMFASCRFVRLAFGEYGEELALIEEKPWTRRKEFLALNPAGTLPILLAEGDVPIVGAAVIAEYLDETRGVLKRDKRLFVEGAMERAEIRRLVEWYLVKAESEVTKHLVRERVLKPDMPQEAGGGSPDSTAIRVARAN